MSSSSVKSVSERELLKEASNGFSSSPSSPGLLSTSTVWRMVDGEGRGWGWGWLSKLGESVRGESGLAGYKKFEIRVKLDRRSV